MQFRANLRSAAACCFSRARMRARVSTPLVIVGTAALLGAGLAGAPLPGATTDDGAARAAAAPPPASTVPALGRRWFALGASVPFLAYRCDFGCGRTRGLRAREATVDRMLRAMSRRGVRVVRWYVFPGDAWQLRRRPDGTPTTIASGALFDLDVAVRMAAKHDVYLLPVVLPEPASVPGTWFTDPAQASALAATLRPLFARHRGNRHVLGWELGTSADQLVDAGIATREQVRTHVAATVRALEAAAPDRLVALGPSDVSRIDTYTGLGANLYVVQDPDGLATERSARAASTSSLVGSEGLDAPVVVGGFHASSTAQAMGRIKEYSRLGYAGALAWSWRGMGHPHSPGARPAIQDEALWRYHYARAGSGPRSRPLNPCYGPSERSYRCPNLRMSKPASVLLGRIGRRSILYSTNSLDSRGDGPASLRGFRNGRFTMAAHQLLHRRRGGPVVVRTGAQLLFKAIPGQYRYWKWNGAARMELWRLDSTGRPIQRSKVGPKTVYCLRDLQRRFPHLAGAPRSRVYPGCSQQLSRRSVTLGTSVGWSDVYPASYHENWIDVTGLRGCFAYVHMADPTNVIYESNEDDNASSVVVKLPWTGSSRGCPGARPIPSTGVNGTY